MLDCVKVLLGGDTGAGIKLAIAIAVLSLGVGSGIGLAAVGIGTASRLMYGEAPHVVQESKVCDKCGAHPR